MRLRVIAHGINSERQKKKNYLINTITLIRG
jgi:hypothetical protein